MYSCVLCGKPFDTATEEHILPNQLGWVLASRTVVCSECNARSSVFDKALIGASPVVTSLINSRRARRKPANVRANQSNAPVTMVPGGRLRRASVFPVHTSGNATYYIVTDEELDQFLTTMEARGHQVGESTPLEFEYTVGSFPYLNVDSRTIIAMLKAAIHFASARGVTLRSTSHAVGFVREAIALGCVPDGRFPFAWDYDTAPMAEKPFYHGLEVVACPDTGCVMARVHVYGLVRARFVLEEGYQGQVHETIRRMEFPAEGKSADSEQFGSCHHPLSHLICRSESRAEAFERARRVWEEWEPSVRPPTLESYGSILELDGRAMG